jgi:hypothetical protein
MRECMCTFKLILRDCASLACLTALQTVTDLTYLHNKKCHDDVEKLKFYNTKSTLHR